MPYSLCDLEGYPTSRPASAGVLPGLSSSLRRVGVLRSPLQRVSAAVAFSGGARYDVAVTPPALGRWELVLHLGDERVPATVDVTVYCPDGQVAMPDGDKCGCAAGTVLKPGAAALLAAGEWGDEEQLCEPCSGYGAWSMAGDDSCDWCAEGFYWLSREEAAQRDSAGHLLAPEEAAAEDGAEGLPQGECTPCPEFATCAAYSTLASLALKQNFWRLSNATLDAHRCVTKEDEAAVTASPCVGGVWTRRSGSSNGSSASASVSGHNDPAVRAYCAEGHYGPLCRGCTEPSWYFDPDATRCEPCAADATPLWVVRMFRYDPLDCCSYLTILSRSLSILQMVSQPLAGTCCRCPSSGCSHSASRGCSTCVPPTWRCSGGCC